MKKAVSLLFLLAERRTKSFPRILGFFEGLIDQSTDDSVSTHIESLLNDYLKVLFGDWEQNRYVISWIFFFLKKRGMKVRVKKQASNLIIKSIRSNKQLIFGAASDFKLFKRITKNSSLDALSETLDVFEPKWESQQGVNISR